MSEPALAAVLTGLPGLTIAVSGGVDSMTLAHAAHRIGLTGLTVVHAVSPAVPAMASARVRDHASRFGWQLRELDAGEFDDPEYRANPVNRCYFCKTNLYARIAGAIHGPIASGANLDDLSDYRPGLTAAAEHGVRHPFVEARMDKRAVRMLARDFGLDDVAELPAQPCLSSRVETGIPISAADLAFIDRMERLLAPLLPRGTDLRCRVTHDGNVVEASAANSEDKVHDVARALCETESRIFLGVRPYRRGAAFLHHRT
jgi:uncharacterized protein